MNLAYIPSPTFSKFQVGPFTIHMYAICILIGICVAVWILTTRWKRYGGTFDPGAVLTRAMTAQVLWNLAGSPAAPGGAGFTDVAADAWYAGAVN